MHNNSTDHALEQFLYESSNQTELLINKYRGLQMKNFKKISAMVLLIASISVLVGCGTGADSGGMSGSSPVKGASL